MATKLQDRYWTALEAVNALVECDESPYDDRYHAIEALRKHIEERARQTGGSIALADLIGEM